MNSTIKILKRYRGIVIDAKSIQKEIDMMYINISSPTVKSVVAGRVSATFPTDKTLNTVLNIEERKAELQKKLEKYQKFLTYVQHSVEQIEDDELRGITRMHFLNGLSWNETNVSLYGKESEYAKNYFYKNIKKIRFSTFAPNDNF